MSAQNLGIDFGVDGPGDIDGIGPDEGVALSVENGIWDATTLTLTYYQDGVSDVDGVLTPDGPATWTIQMMNEAGPDEVPRYGYIFTQLTPIDHVPNYDPSDHDETAEWNVNLVVMDGDGDTASATIHVAIDDSGPSIFNDETPGAPYGTLTVKGDESLEIGEPVDDPYVHQAVTGIIDFGTDGMADTNPIVMSMSGYTLNADYTWDGTTLSFYQYGDAATAANATWTIEMKEDATGGNWGYEFNQIEAVTHPFEGDGTEMPVSYHDEPFNWSIDLQVTD
ncbi:MAG: hypothetical protein HUN05_18410 [Desulfobacter sp.]|nr:MAG: hypothetical protein HUN05_18410 [Desulfobacter sp.]